MRAPGSFRDPAGSVVLHEDSVSRSCTAAWRWVADDFLGSDLYRELTASQAILPAAWDAGRQVYTQRRLARWTYPYEWSFSMLQRAALLTLEVQRRALLAGFSLKDASAYNITFDGLAPIHVDLFSFERWKPGLFWQGMEQFYREFLNPLLLESSWGIRYQPLYRAEVNGISTDLMSRLSPFPLCLHPAIFSSVTLKNWSARLEGNRNRGSIVYDSVPEKTLMSMQLRRILLLEKKVRRLRAASSSAWEGYRLARLYSTEELIQKRETVSEFLESQANTWIVDYGCHDGEYSRIALEKGHRVIGLDADADAIDRMFRSFSAGKIAAALTLVVNNMANPSPGVGWNYEERSMLSQRLMHTELFMALAICHHLRVIEGIPSEMLCEWFYRHHRAGILEYVSPSDPMTVRMCAQRSGMDLSDYEPESFRSILGRFFFIRREISVSEHRTLLWLERR